MVISAENIRYYLDKIKFPVDVYAPKGDHVCGTVDQPQFFNLLNWGLIVGSCTRNKVRKFRLCWSRRPRRRRGNPQIELDKRYRCRLLAIIERSARIEIKRDFGGVANFKKTDRLRVAIRANQEHADGTEVTRRNQLVAAVGTTSVPTHATVMLTFRVHPPQTSAISTRVFSTTRSKHGCRTKELLSTWLKTGSALQVFSRASRGYLKWSNARGLK